MKKTIGKKVLIAKMIEGGQEMFLGVKKDPQLGPIVIIGMGGVFSELFDEMIFVIPPFNKNYIKQSIGKFKFGRILSGYRGKDKLRLEAFYESAEKFSILISEMKSEIREFDINPMILTDSGCTAVDALAVGEDLN
jgi:acetyltransferase